MRIDFVDGQPPEWMLGIEFPKFPRYAGKNMRGVCSLAQARRLWEIARVVEIFDGDGNTQGTVVYVRMSEDGSRWRPVWIHADEAPHERVAGIIYESALTAHDVERFVRSPEWNGFVATALVRAAEYVRHYCSEDGTD